MKNYYTYVYCDPRYTNKERGYSYFGGKLKLPCRPFYVGQGIGSRRFGHLYSKKRWRGRSSPVCNRIEKLRNLGLEPDIMYTKPISKKQAIFREEKFIVEIGRKDLKTGPLLNRSDGLGCKNPSSRTIKKMSEFLKKQWEDPEFRKNKSKSTTEQLKKQWKDSEYREKRRKASRESAEKRWASLDRSKIGKKPNFTDKEANNFLEEYEFGPLSYRKMAQKYKVPCTTLKRTVRRAFQKRKQVGNG